MDTIADVDRKIQLARDELEQLLRNKAILEEAHKQLSPTQKLAIALHDATCRHNHTDYCGWFYEVDTTTQVHKWDRGSTHDDWLTKAGKFARYCETNGIKIDDAVEVLEFTKQL